MGKAKDINESRKELRRAEKELATDTAAGRKGEDARYHQLNDRVLEARRDVKRAIRGK